MNLFDIASALLRPIATTALSPASLCSVWSAGLAVILAFAWLAGRRRRRGRRAPFRLLLRAVFSRRVLFHRSTRADLAYAALSLAIFGAAISYAVVSTAWIGDGVAAFLAVRFGEAAHRAPEGPPGLARDIARTAILFLAYDLGFFVDHTLKHRIPALWELHKTHHSAEALTPLVNFRVHPLDALILANSLALFIGVGGGVAAFMLGPRAASLTLFDVNVLMLAYVFLTAQLQHSQIWIPFTGVAGRIVMSPAHHQLHHSADPAHFNCNMGASLAVWDWMFGTLKVPARRSPRLRYGAAGFDHDPHSLIGLLVEPAAKFLVALARLTARDRWRGERKGRLAGA